MTQYQSQIYEVFVLNEELYVIGRITKYSMIFQKCRPPDYTWEDLLPPLIPSGGDEMRIALIKNRLCEKEIAQRT